MRHSFNLIALLIICCAALASAAEPCTPIPEADVQITELSADLPVAVVGDLIRLTARARNFGATPARGELFRSQSLTPLQGDDVPPFGPSDSAQGHRCVERHEPSTSVDGQREQVEIS